MFRISLLFILIPFQHLLSSLLPIYNLSLFILFIFLSIFKWSKNIKKSKIFTLLLILDIYLIFVSIIYIFINSNQLYPFLRQFISFEIGILIFLFLRYIFLCSSDKDIIKYTLYGFYIVILVAIYQKIFQHSYRIYGTFSEPSYFGRYLVFLVLPSLIIFRNQINKKSFYFNLFFFVILLILTYSTTSFVKLLEILFAYLIFSNVNIKSKIQIILSTILFIFLLLFYFFYINPNNYLYIMTNYVLLGLMGKNVLPTTLTYRLNFWYALLNLKVNFETVFGYGFGGDSIYYSLILPKKIVEEHLLMNPYGIVEMASFWGKILVYGGLIAIVIFTLIYNELFKILKYLSKYGFIKYVLIAIIIDGTINNGQFIEITTWFWLAFIDSKFIINARKELSNTVKEKTS